MKNRLIWKILFAVGLFPFAAPFAAFCYHLINKDSWELFDWLIMYSFVYWPTYLIGAVLIVLSLFMLKKQRNKTGIS